jgi:hypothetical protein
MESDNGIKLEKYAELCAKMNDVFQDEEACDAIAEQEGYSRETWRSARERWQSKITDPADMGMTASRFQPMWQAAIDKLKTKTKPQKTGRGSNKKKRSGN